MSHLTRRGKYVTKIFYAGKEINYDHYCPTKSCQIYFASKFEIVHNRL